MAGHDGLQETWKEQARAFKGLSEFVQALTNHLDNRERQLQEENL